MADDKPANFGNSGDWWTTTKAHPDIFRPAYQNAENDAFIRETVGIDSALLANDLGISAVHVQAYQRKLGVRKITGNEPRKSKTDRRLART
jgi:hypothetical protein